MKQFPKGQVTFFPCNETKTRQVEKDDGDKIDELKEDQESFKNNQRKREQYEKDKVEKY